ncbi:MAG: anthranilate phosphoribosyltransferase [Clostridia bacterium]|nr:anthranilate phosphoribosyltransferase [Deltaproteobacteria bacterium]
MNALLETVIEGGVLSRDQAYQAMHVLLAPDTKAEQIGAFLATLRLRGETVDEVVGFVSALQEQVVRTRARPDAIDVCGTGGDGLGTFNVSTTVAFVVAAAGQPLAKHGNRSVSSKCGSFDVLDALGVKFATQADDVDAQLDAFGLGFYFAPAFHPALMTLRDVRRNLGVYTVFNLLGPLLNPAQAKKQLIGVYRSSAVPLVAEVLLALGVESAWVVRGDDGLDEISVGGPTSIARVSVRGIERATVTPEAVGIPRAHLDELAGGDTNANARILVGILDGETGARRDVVTLNAGAALTIAGKATSLQEGMNIAREAIDSGRARDLLKRMQA